MITKITTELAYEVHYVITTLQPPPPSVTLGLSAFFRPRSGYKGRLHLYSCWAFKPVVSVRVWVQETLSFAAFGLAQITGNASDVVRTEVDLRYSGHAAPVN